MREENKNVLLVKDNQIYIHGFEEKQIKKGRIYLVGNIKIFIQEYKNIVEDENHYIFETEESGKLNINQSLIPAIKKMMNIQDNEFELSFEEYPCTRNNGFLYICEKKENYQKGYF